MQVEQYTKSNHEVHRGVPFSLRLSVKRGRQYMYSTTIFTLKTHISEKKMSTDTNVRYSSSSSSLSIVYHLVRHAAIFSRLIFLTPDSEWTRLDKLRFLGSLLLAKKPVNHHQEDKENRYPIPFSILDLCFAE